MRTLHRLIVAFAAVAVFSLLYVPQPLQKTLADAFGVGPEAVTLLVAVTMLPLAAAPLFYGLILQRLRSRTLLVGSVSALALIGLGMGAASSFGWLLALRVLQGVATPAALTALMTYVSCPGDASGKRDVRRELSLYVAATIFGGFFGRFLAWLLATPLGWRAPFLVVSGMLALAVVLLRALPADTTAGFARPDTAAVMRVLRSPGVLRVYTLIFCAFFVFAALLNMLPFRLAELSPGVSELRVGLAYSGYLMGILVSIGSGRIVALLGERKALAAGAALHCLATVCFLAPSVWLCFGAMFLFCAGMFTTHSLAPGRLNRMAGDSRGVVNGLYVSFYYAGGALGAWLPGFVYRAFGWGSFIALLCSALLVAVAVALGLAPDDASARTAVHSTKTA